LHPKNLAATTGSIIHLVVKGAGLESLLADLASQRIAELREPSRSDYFENTAAPTIREITVKRIEEQI
jgi:hypothetical protein